MRLRRQGKVIIRVSEKKKNTGMGYEETKSYSYIYSLGAQVVDKLLRNYTDKELCSSVTFYMSLVF
jgi:hypothetical protein